MPLISARIVNLIKPDTAVGFAEAGEDQSVFCASVIQLQGQILGDDPALHTFEWEQSFGTPVTLVNPNTLFPTFINPQTSDIEFTLYVDRGTPFETSDTVFISRRPSSFNRTMIAGSNFAPPSKMPTGAFSVNTANSTFSNTQAIDVDFTVGAYSYNYPPDSTYSPIYKAEDLRRIKDNLGGKYWLMRDVDMSELNYPWDPLGTPQRPFSGELQGNGFSIKNLSITQASDAVNATSLDPLYNNTVAILTFNQSVDGSLSTYNEVVDLSPSQHNITYGPVAYADDGTVEGDPLYGTYLLCDGNASRWVDLDASTDFDFGTGDFCIEFWYRPSGFNLVQGLMASGSEFGPGWSIHQRRSNESYGLNLYVGGSIIIGRNMNGVVTLNDWNHAAFTREGTNLRLFVNGVQQGVTETDSTNVTSSGNFTVGNGRSAHNVSSYADMDEVRITKGAARYTTNFTPPTYSYDATIGSVAGLFSYIGNGAVIEQVGITDANINITNVDTVAYKGILAGSAQGPLSNDGGAVTVRNLYVSGTVDAGTDGAGGLIGHTGANVSSLYENTYSDVTVTGSGADVGGWAGRFDTTATYNDNFWNSDKTTAGVGTGGDTPIAGEVDSLTTAQLQVQSNYTNWDFDTVWQMPELKDNIGPAQLQNNIFGRVVNDFGASLETGTPQAVLWKPPNTATNAGNSGSEQSFRLYKGAIIEDQNPVTLGWENRRFIPAEQASALMTPGRRHRAFMVYDVEPNIIFNPATKIAEREVAYLVPETVVERGTGWPFAGGTSKYIAQVVGSAGGATQDAINITITNPRKIALTVEDPILSSMIVGSDDFLGGTSTATLNYFVGTTFNSPDDILGVTGIIGGGDEGGQVGISITRAYGGTIG